MDKENIAECVRVMAVHLAEYQRRFGEIPRQDLLELVGATKLSDLADPPGTRENGTARRLLDVGAGRIIATSRRACVATGCLSRRTVAQD